MNVTTLVRIETKFLRLREPVPWGHEIDGWHVCWLGGWGKCRVFYIVMVMKRPTVHPIDDLPLTVERSMIAIRSAEDRATFSKPELSSPEVGRYTDSAESVTGSRII
jgi:hypothetical protein